MWESATQVPYSGEGQGMLEGTARQATDLQVWEPGDVGWESAMHVPYSGEEEGMLGGTARQATDMTVRESCKASAGIDEQQAQQRDQCQTPGNSKVVLQGGICFCQAFPWQLQWCCDRSLGKRDTIRVMWV